MVTKALKTAIAANLGDSGEAAKRAIEATIGSLVKPIIDLADRMHKQHGQFQALLFAIIRKVDSRGKAEELFFYVEMRVREHFAEVDEQGKLVGELPRLADIGGLASWDPVKSKLLKGYNYTVKCGNESVEAFKGNPTDDRYKGKDGASLWIKDYQDAGLAKIKEYEDKLAKDAAAKVAEATAPSNQGRDGNVTLSKSTVIQLPDGNDARLTFQLPEAIQAQFSKLTRQVQEACKLETGSPLFHKLVAQHLSNCADQIATLITTTQGEIKKQLNTRPKMSREQATQALADRGLRRRASDNTGAGDDGDEFDLSDVGGEDEELNAELADVG